MTKQRIMNDTEHILLDSKQTADITHRVQREITLTPHYYTVRTGNMGRPQLDFQPCSL